jgi:ADP-ribose pyrophosphatase
VNDSRKWREIQREKIADCRVFEVERSTAVSPIDGSEHDFYRVTSRDWVQIVPVTADQQVVMVRQFRHGSSEFVLEIPGGIVDEGETPADAAARECREETGFACCKLHSLGSINPNPAFHAHRLHAFYSLGAHKVGEIQNTGTEQTEVVLVPVAEIAEMLAAGHCDHALVAATLWRFLYDQG